MRRGNLQESWRSVVPTLKIWDSEAQVALINQWKSAHAKIVSEPEDRPWKLRELMAADLDDNSFVCSMISGGTCKRQLFSLWRRFPRSCPLGASHIEIGGQAEVEGCTKNSVGERNRG